MADEAIGFSSLFAKRLVGQKCGLLRLDTTPSSPNFTAISMVLSIPHAVDLNQ
jgi:hypothetical protein